MQRLLKVFLGVALVAGVYGCGAPMNGADGVSAQSQDVQSNDLKPNGKGGGLYVKFAKPSGGGGHKTTSSNGINYHGGPLMLGTPTIYYIYYGNFSSTQQSYLETFMKNLSGSAYENINTTYYDGTNTHVSGNFVNGKSYATSEYLGQSLSDAQIFQVVTDAIGGGALPLDSNGLYFVLTSADVTASSGFCSQYCGWHSNGSYQGATLKYSFVGNPDRCPSSCEAQTVAPSGDTGTSGMTSIMAHESEEAISDALGTAWYDRRGYENADKCAWTFGTESTDASGAKYNLTLGGTNYLVQQNWVNASGGYCAMSY